MRTKKRARSTALARRPVSFESLEPRRLLSATFGITPLGVPSPTQPDPVAPFLAAHGSADPGDEMVINAAISPGGASAGVMAVLVSVQNFAATTWPTTYGIFRAVVLIARGAGNYNSPGY